MVLVAHVIAIELNMHDVSYWVTIDFSSKRVMSTTINGRFPQFGRHYDYVVVWDQLRMLGQDYDILAQAVNSNSQLTSVRRDISTGSGNFDRFPSISKSSGRKITPIRW